MAPNGNMGDDASQSDSFSLANMLPQYHADNAGSWAEIEEAVRDAATIAGELDVVTAPLSGAAKSP